MASRTLSKSDRGPGPLGALADPLALALRLHGLPRGSDSSAKPSRVYSTPDVEVRGMNEG